MNIYTLTKRRNLLLTSILLFLISFAGVDIENDLTLISLKLHIEDPHIIYMILWGLYFYFLIRFLQVLFDPYDKEASEARKLFSFMNHPPWHFLKVDSYNGILIIRLMKFLVEIILSFLMLVFKSIFEKDFFEYLFPILFAITIGIASYYSPFMELKKEVIFQKIDNIYNGTKNKVDEVLLSENINS